MRSIGDPGIASAAREGQEHASVWRPMLADERVMGRSRRLEEVLGAPSRRADPVGTILKQSQEATAAAAAAAAALRPDWLSPSWQGDNNIMLVIREELKTASDRYYCLFLRELMYGLHLHHTLPDARMASGAILADLISTGLRTVPASCPATKMTCFDFASRNVRLMDRYITHGRASAFAADVISRIVHSTTLDLSITDRYARMPGHPVS